MGISIRNPWLILPPVEQPVNLCVCELPIVARRTYRSGRNRHNGLPLTERIWIQKPNNGGWNSLAYCSPRLPQGTATYSAVA
jgi:hypothetical protein